ncbi:MAG: mannitol dehydrogenase family protein, partial [Lachnospiraceae bacterium]|nr:mannitol dehydrogenase family protein [Lachnospiraceae bacterium]
GWLRYLLGVDDNGRRYELSPDPVAEELSVKFASIRPGDPSTVGDLLKPVLADEGLYGVNLYSAGLGEKVETMFREMLAGNGSVRKTVHKYMEMIPDEALKGV